MSIDKLKERMEYIYYGVHKQSDLANHINFSTVKSTGLIRDRGNQLSSFLENIRPAKQLCFDVFLVLLLVCLVSVLINLLIGKNYLQS